LICRAAAALILGLILAPAVLLATAANARLHIDPAFEPTSAEAEPAFTLTVDDQPLTRNARAVFVMPGDVLDLAARNLPGASELVLQTSGQGVIESAGPSLWRWRAPTAPGLYPLAIYNRERASRRRLNVFVQRPFDAREREIDGYRIGHYQPHGLHGRASSAPPAGFVKVTPSNRGVRVSEHFTLGQFLCHQQPDHWPKYLRLRPRLLDKLERIHAALAEAGFDINTVTVMSGFRTPWYNADIGNTTIYSQHLFGSAADVFVDVDGDGRIDDLDGDGRIDIADARWLADRVAALTAEHPELQGGLSAYPGNARHGPFVHLDVRGVRARW